MFTILLTSLLTLSLLEGLHPAKEDTTHSSEVKWWREDLRCGVKFKLKNNRPAECDPLHPKGLHCCSDQGWCGGDAAHCKCKGCKSYKARWRRDLRCGTDFKIPGSHHGAQCDPFHPQAKSCCSEIGWCGGLEKHCKCKECQDYSALYRKDLRCGDKYKLPNGEKAQCNPKHNRGYVCCSASGWCGKTNAHCKCKECVDYRKKGLRG